MPAPFQRYELHQRIGQGGMAEAWKARGIAPDGSAVPLVIKKILPELSRDPAFKQMFIDEAAIASQLEHPNIVRFLDFGRLDDQLYIALELVDGADVLRMSRTAREAGRKIGLAAAVAVASGVLAALEHAHTRTGPKGRPLKIVHRDVSAPNVLVSFAGEVKLSDFGIAVAAMRASHTATGMVRGNPRYMSPEQIRGDEVDPRTDVYSTGLLLHSILSGEHPFDRDTLLRAVYRCMHGDIPPPSRANAEVPATLDRIVMKAIRVDRRERYGSAKEFLEALAAWQRESGTSSSGALARLMGELFPRDAPGPAKAGAPRPAPWEKPAAEVSSAELTAQSDDSGRGIYLTKGVPAAPSDAAPEPPPAVAAQRENIRAAHADGVSAVAVLSESRVASAGNDGLIRTWTLPSLEPELTLPGHQGPVTAIAASPDRSRLASVGKDCAVRLWDLATGKEIRTLGRHDGWAFCVAFGPRGVVASGGIDGKLRVWSAESATAIAAHADVVSGVALVPDGRRALTGSYDHTLKLWDLEKGTLLRELKSEMDGVRAVAISPDGSQALSAGADHLLRLWDLATGAELWCVQGHRDAVVAVAFSSDGRFAASGSYDRTVKLWGVDGGYEIRTFAGHKEPVLSVAFSREGEFLVSGGGDGTLRVHDLRKL